MSMNAPPWRWSLQRRHGCYKFPPRAQGSWPTFGQTKLTRIWERLYSPRGSRVGRRGGFSLRRTVPRDRDAESPYVALRVHAEGVAAFRRRIFGANCDLAFAAQS